MLSFGMFTLKDLSTADRSLKLKFWSPPPSRAATVIRRAMRVNMAERLASAGPLYTLIFDHSDWDIGGNDALKITQTPLA
jgi:hypothetical protein